MKKTLTLGRAMSDGKKNGNNYGCLILFGLVFGGFGSIFVFIMLILPLWRVMDARDWVEVPCTIIESRVGEHHDNDGGPTYRVEVRFSYAFSPNTAEIGPEAPTYESSEYDFKAGSYSSGRAAKKEVVNTLKPGSKNTCAVNPENPSEAVLVRNVPDDIWFGLIPLLFPLFGIILIYVGLRMRRTARLKREGVIPLSAQASAQNPFPVIAATTSGPVELNLEQSRLGKAVGLGIFSLIWNGFVWSVIFFAIIPDLKQGDFFAWFPLLFMSIFVIVGLIVFGAFVHQLLGLTNPKLKLTVNKQTLSPGDTLDLSWECSGNTSKVNAFTITLEGRESATYRRGTNTHTDKHTFARLPIVTLDNPASLLTGRASLPLPPNSVSSFKSDNNALEWVLVVKGTIPRWPDVHDEYTIVINSARSTP